MEEIYEFKVGDKVRLLDNTGSKKYEALPIGSIHTIKKIETGTTKVERLTLITLDNGLIMFAYRFELASKKQSSTKLLTLPTDSESRKDVPVFSGCVKYFPAALAGVSKISKAGNDKHNPGQELHHDRSKSLDHKDCILRHLMDTEDLIAALERGQIESTEQILAEVNALAWRALAYSQSLHEKYAGAPLAPGAKLKKGNENE